MCSRRRMFSSAVRLSSAYDIEAMSMRVFASAYAPRLWLPAESSS